MGLCQGTTSVMIMHLTQGPTIPDMMRPIQRVLQQIRRIALVSVPEMSRWGLYPVAVFLLITAWMWAFPMPGWAISILGLGAVIVAVRSAHKMPLWEEICWLVIAFALCGAEMRTLYKDRADQEQTSGEARAAQTRSFLGIANGLSESIKQSQQQFAATMDKSNKIFGGVQTNLDAVTGGKTFAEFVAVPNMGSGNPVTYPLTVFINGKYPIKNMAAQIQKVEPQRDNASIYRQMQSMHLLPIGGDVLPGPHELNERLGIGKYGIGIWAANGLSNEELELRLDEQGQLQQSYEVWKDGRLMVKVKNGKLISRQQR
jgi:hypothetical protein